MQVDTSDKPYSFQKDSVGEKFGDSTIRIDDRYATVERLLRSPYET